MFFYVSFSNSHEGFLDDVTVVNEEDDATDDYLYDANGNMIQDQNKHITSILYNHLNLPIKVSFDTVSYITYLYNATGVKINKFVYTITSSNPTSSLTEYIDGFQYRAERKENSRWLFLANEPGCRVGELQFIFTPEGYVNNTVIDGINFFNYVYNYTDHLGNIRLSYTWDEEIEDLSILEEHQYYPFGLEHKYYNNTRKMYDKVSKEITLQDGSKANIVIPQVIQVANSGYQYQYNGKEWQDELGLDWYDYGARSYMPDIGRWGQIDPLAEIYHTDTPFAYVLNNPLSYIDPDGRSLIGVTNDDAKKVHDDLNSVFADSKFDKLRGLLTRGEKNNKKFFDKIGDDVLKDALSGLTGDDLALAEYVTGAINSDAEHKVEYVKAGTDLSNEGEKAYNSAFSRIYTDNGFPVPTFDNRTGTDVRAVGGEGYNAPTANGSHTFIVDDIGTNHAEGRREITTFHEIFGHGIASARRTSDAINNQNAIRVENLVRRVLGIQKQRDGADHAGGVVPGPSALPTVKNL